MAALSPDLGPDDVIPALARNVVTNGYQAASSNEALEQTEYLKLVIRYLSQARELEKLAGADKIIKIETCDSSQTAELLRVLGYRMRGACGSEVVLETVNATRAFLTIDSGFPLAELEQSLRTNRQPFAYDYKPTQCPGALWSRITGFPPRIASGDPISSILSWAILPCAGCIWVCPSSTPQPRTSFATPPPCKRFARTRMCWIFMAGCSRCATAMPYVPGGARNEKVLDRTGGCLAR